MLKKQLLFVVTLLLPITVSSATYFPDNKTVEHYRKNEIILNYKNGVDINALKSLIDRMDTKIVYRSRFASFVTVSFDTCRYRIWELIDEFQSLPEIDFAEPNGIAHILWVPNDPYFQYQWNFDVSHINMPLAWDIERGGSSTVIVSILDTGIAYELHEIPGNEQEEVSSEDGYYHQSPDLTMTNFVNGYDFIKDDSHPNDENGHGTHVCGTIAQSTNNAKGVAGMAFNVSIMPVRVLDHTGSGEVDKIADGIYYAYQNGADILSMSLGGAPGDSTGFQTVHQAIISATNAGALVVAAAGNEAEGKLSYPAGYNECIAVGATDINDTLAPYSQWGEGLDIVAPGGNIYDTIPGTEYAAGILQSTYYQINDGYHLATVDSFCYMFLQGTSMAAPHVSGLAALLISHGVTDPSAIKQAIYSTAADLGPPGYDTYFGYGLINPSLSLGADPLFISLPIIQNPYSLNYIDIWVVSHRPLWGDIPDTCRVTFNDENSYLNFQKMEEQTYRTDFHFDTSGTATVYVSGRDTSGTKGNISRNFTVTEIAGKTGGSAFSSDERFRLTIPSYEGLFNYWILITSEQFETESTSYIPLSLKYNCGAGTSEMVSPSVVRFHLAKNILENNDFRDIGIYCLNSEEPEYIDTEIDIENVYAYATIQEFGEYIVLLEPGKGQSSRLNTKKLLFKCYPVPVRERLYYDYVIPAPTNIDIVLYDITGRRIEYIEKNSTKDFGKYTGSVNINEINLPCGIYFLKIFSYGSGGATEVSKKIVLLK
jgi:serine protease